MYSFGSGSGSGPDPYLLHVDFLLLLLALLMLSLGVLWQALTKYVRASAARVSRDVMPLAMAQTWGTTALSTCV